MYYYDHNWRMLAEYDGSNNIRRKFAYGKTIDEVLFMIDSDSTEYAGTPPGTCFAARSSEEFMDHFESGDTSPDAWRFDPWLNGNYP